MTSVWYWIWQRERDMGRSVVLKVIFSWPEPARAGCSATTTANWTLSSRGTPVRMCTSGSGSTSRVWWSRARSRRFSCMWSWAMSACIWASISRARCERRSASNTSRASSWWETHKSMLLFYYHMHKYDDYKWLQREGYNWLTQLTRKFFCANISRMLLK